MIASIAAATVVASCSGDEGVEPELPGSPHALVVVSGDGQTAQVGTELAQALTVVLKDSVGRVIPGRSVTFAVTSGGGAVLLGSTATDGQGLAADRWTLGTNVAQEQRVEARLVDPSTGRTLRAAFTATATVGAPHTVTARSGSAQEGQPGQALGDSVAALVTDEYGNPLSGVAVAWAVTGGGSISPASSSTDGSGVARARWTLGLDESQSQEATATVNGLSPARFVAGFAPPGAPASLEVLAGDGQSGEVATRLAIALTVVLKDATGRVVPGKTITFAVTSGGGTLEAANATTDGQGRAANFWTLGPSTSATHTAEARHVDGESGKGFVVTFTATARPGAAHVIAVRGGNAQYGFAAKALADSLAVVVRDVYRNPVPGLEVAWAASGGGGLSPASTVTDTHGVARTSWTLGPDEALPQTATASVTGLASASFSAWFHGTSVDFGAGRWETLAPLPVAVRSPAVATHGGKIYVFGGTTAQATRTRATQVFDPATGVWSMAADVPLELDFAFAAVTSVGIHVMGGRSESDRSSKHFLYDPVGDTWSHAPDLPIGVSAASGEVLDDKIYVVGGVTGARDYRDEVQVFDPAASTWSSGVAYPFKHLSASSERINGRIHVVGGTGTGLTTRADHYLYERGVETWSSAQALPEAREALATGVTRGNLCAFGGRLANSFNFGPPFATSYCYDFTSEAWRPVTDLPSARAEMGSGSVGDWIYVIGGHDTSFRVVPTVYRFTGVAVSETPSPPGRED